MRDLNTRSTHGLRRAAHRSRTAGGSLLRRLRSRRLLAVAVLATVTAGLHVGTVAQAVGVINEPMVGMAGTRSGHGYWLVGSDGGIFAFGDASGHGSTGGQRLNKPIVGIAATRDGEGYWLTGADGGVFPFGTAIGLGSVAGLTLNAPIVAIAGTPDGAGYWLAGADGGVFPFGSARGFGSTADRSLNAPIVGMSAAPDGRGYWLAARDGGVFPFGSAQGYGTIAVAHQPVVGIAAAGDGRGYWLVTSDGGVFPFGSAQGYGSTGGLHLNQPIVGIESLPFGYWLVARDGGVFPFGQAGGYGSTGGSAIASDTSAASDPATIERLIRDAAARHGVPSDWMMKIARCESGLNPRAYNHAGPYIGLFQFAPSTFRAHGGTDIYDPVQQAEITATMLSQGGSRAWSCA